VLLKPGGPAKASLLGSAGSTPAALHGSGRFQPGSIFMEIRRDKHHLCASYPQQYRLEDQSRSKSRYFQKFEMNDAFSLANRLQNYRQVKAFEVTYLRVAVESL
jgi:hypothetical protein